MWVKGGLEFFGPALRVVCDDHLQRVEHAHHAPCLLVEVLSDSVLQFADINDLINKPETASLQANLSNIRLQLREIYRFQPDLRNNEYFRAVASAPVSGAIRINGKLDNLSVNPVNLNWRNTRINGSGTLLNATDPDRLAFNFPKVDFRTHRNDLLYFVKESDLGIRTVGQLLDYFPRAYHDQGQVTLIGDVGRTGDSQTIQGKVAKQSYIRPRRSGGKAFAKIAIYDGTGIAQLVVFGNQRISYLRKALSVETYVVVSGKFERKYREIQSSNFEFEVITDEEAERIHTGRIVPKYSLTSNLTQRSVRRWVKNTLDAYVAHYPEFLPEELRRKYALLDWHHAISEIFEKNWLLRKKGKSIVSLRIPLFPRRFFSKINSCYFSCFCSYNHKTTTTNISRSRMHYS